VSSGSWTLDLDSELNVVIPWLDRESDPERRSRLLGWLAVLLTGPDRPASMDADNVFSAVLPRDDVVVIWHLDTRRRVVLISHIGDL
jgi:hypothetical protein